MNTLSPGEKANLLALRFWPTWIGLALLRVIHILPYTLQLAIGSAIGKILRLAQKRRVHIANRNLELCLPKLSDTDREELLKRNFQALGMTLIEGAMSWWGSDRRILGLVDFEGEEHLVAALQSGKGVILLTGHLTSMELAAHMMGLKFGIAAMYRPLKNPVMDKQVKQAREKHMSPVFARSDVRTMTRTLKAGKAVWYGFDQNYGLKHSVFTPFFGVPAATITSTSRFAGMGDALVVPFFPYRQASGRYRIEIFPALESFPGKSIEHDTRRLNAILEEAIMKAPEQYLWIHRRFKTRPQGEPDIYT
ncbi:MAG: LpxL/LpxP family Kdo(2)-lipid IV(A) lauroyl/palmitoleoyl acyltransferase [Candidatus Sedimenticola sp. PURPLELP]